MKYLLPLFIPLLFCLSTKAQLASLQAGPVISYFGKNVTNYGGELVSTFKAYKNISAGVGLQVLQFSCYSNVFVPVFATLQTSLSSNKFVYYFHIDPGYIISHYYSSFTDKADNGEFKFEDKTSTGFYLGTGAGIHLKTKASPYINFQSSFYHVNNFQMVTDIAQSKVYNYPDKRYGVGLTLTAGVWLDTRKK